MLVKNLVVKCFLTPFLISFKNNWTNKQTHKDQLYVSVLFDFVKTCSNQKHLKWQTHLQYCNCSKVGPCFETRTVIIRELDETLFHCVNYNNCVVTNMNCNWVFLKTSLLQLRFLSYTAISCSKRPTVSSWRPNHKNVRICNKNTNA